MSESFESNCIGEVKTAGIVYFSGTGGTTRVARCFEDQLSAKGIEVTMTALDMHMDNSTSLEELQTNLLVLLFPVFACDAPQPIYDWIEKAPDTKGVHAAVISVSGGGEVFPNKACRAGCIKKLESKGYKVFYERMIVMPSNIFIGLNDHLAARLLQVMPVRVEIYVSEILGGVSRRTKPKLSSRLMVKFVSSFEKKSVKTFRNYIEVTEACAGCRWCSDNCPMGNIKMDNKRPVFGESCTACLRCYYGCPVHAIKMKKFKSFTVKEGYNLDKLEKRMMGVELEPAEKYCKGMAFVGIRKYLFEEN